MHWETRALASTNMSSGQQRFNRAQLAGHPPSPPPPLLLDDPRDPLELPFDPLLELLLPNPLLDPLELLPGPPKPPLEPLLVPDPSSVVPPSSFETAMIAASFPALFGELEHAANATVSNAQHVAPTRTAFGITYSVLGKTRSMAEPSDERNARSNARSTKPRRAATDARANTK
jgi:hypothetical protein